MKSILFAAITLALFSSVHAQEPTLRWEFTQPNSYSIYLEGGNLDNQFDTLIVDITPISGVQFTNIDDGFDGFTPRDSGESFTFINARLDLPPTLGGEGFLVINPITTEQSVSFIASPFGQPIDTGDDGLFLANVVPTDCNLFESQVTLISQGQVVSELSTAGACPEPTSMLLAGLGLVGLLGKRLRNPSAESESS